MFNTTSSSILAGAIFDQRCDDASLRGSTVGTMCADTLRGSLRNPLQAMRLLAIDPVEGMDFGSAALAAVTGAPADWFDDDLLSAPPAEVLTMLGKMALIYLATLRSQALEEAPLREFAREDCLHAVETMAEVLAMNAQQLLGKAH